MGIRWAGADIRRLMSAGVRDSGPSLCIGPRPKTFAPRNRGLHKARSAPAYQIVQRSSRTMGSPALQPKACWKAGIFEGAPMARKLCRGCGLVFT